MHHTRMKLFFLLIRTAIIGLSLSLLSSCAELTELEKNLTGKTPLLTPRVYVANESSNSVSVIDALTFKVIATVDAKNFSTHDLALSRDGTRLYATNLASGRLSVKERHFGQKNMIRYPWRLHFVILPSQPLLFEGDFSRLFW